MTTEQATQWVVDHHFDRETCRHSDSAFDTVLHCHHYATLYCQLADDADLFHGRELLTRASEMAFYDVLTAYFRNHQVRQLEDRVALVEDYWRNCGFGLLTFDYVGILSGAAHMDQSHVDAGWIKKWGRRNKPVNFIGQGYVAAAMAALYDLPTGSYRVFETESIVSGDQASRFSAVRA